MLDIQLIRKNPDFVREKLAIRGVDVDFTDFLKKCKISRCNMFVCSFFLTKIETISCF